jgi:hypothetical protein
MEGDAVAAEEEQEEEEGTHTHRYTNKTELPYTKP